MDRKSTLLRSITIALVFAISSTFFTLSAQDVNNAAIESITAEELKGHIYFLASDYLGGRIGPSAEYEIAAQYVGAQFAAAGLQPVIEAKDGSLSFFQGVPFAKTQYGDEIVWSLTRDGEKSQLKHKEDFKILYASQVNHDETEIVYVGYGIEEPDYKWNDFKKLDIEGKIMLIMAGAPQKDGKPVLS